MPPFSTIFALAVAIAAVTPLAVVNLVASVVLLVISAPPWDIIEPRVLRGEFSGLGVTSVAVSCSSSPSLGLADSMWAGFGPLV